jgi:hypothetical protein
MYVRRENKAVRHIRDCERGQPHHMNETHVSGNDRKTYYVAVGAGQVLEDQEAAAFEFAIQANEKELGKLQELFEHTTDADEDATFSVSGWPTVSDRPDHTEYDSHIKEIYRMLHRLGTEETKRHIESMKILH